MVRTFLKRSWVLAVVLKSPCIQLRSLKSTWFLYLVLKSPLNSLLCLCHIICTGNSMICSDIWHNTTSDISKLLYVISRPVRRVKFETILKYHLQIVLLIVYTTTRRRFLIFTCRYFKLSWNTTALSQSNCRNFSCSSIICDIGFFCRGKIWLLLSVRTCKTYG